MKRAVCSITAVLLACVVPGVLGQAGDTAALQQKLNSSFRITTTAANHSDIAAPGDMVELHKDGLKMSALSTVLTESNTYKDGKIGGGAAKRAWGSFGTAMMKGMVEGMDSSGQTTVPDGIPPITLASGDRCWILAITVKEKDGVIFKLLSEPDGNGMRYHADLKFPFPNKKQVPPADAFLQTIAEVLTVAPVEEQAAAPAPPAPQRNYEEIAPPPPPPPAPVVKVGESRTQVITDFGQPQKKSAVGAKVLYYYTTPKMKVTFINGKVSSID